MRLGLVLFFIIPIIEMVILIEVGSAIGALPTVALVVLTATIGIWLLRLEGLATLARVQAKLDNGEIPGTELLEGIMLLVGGALLLTPGFFTDAVGFCCLLPGLRRPIANWLIRQGLLRAVRVDAASAHASWRSENGTTIDGEFEERNRERLRNRNDSDKTRQ